VPKTIIKCERCGELFVRPFEERRVNRCPACARMSSLKVVDLSERPEIVRRLKTIREERPVRRKYFDV
jgi:uncharacterized OB-fold protein